MTEQEALEICKERNWDRIANSDKTRWIVGPRMATKDGQFLIEARGLGKTFVEAVEAALKYVSQNN